MSLDTRPEVHFYTYDREHPDGWPSTGEVITPCEQTMPPDGGKPVKIGEGKSVNCKTCRPIALKAAGINPEYPELYPDERGRMEPGLMR